MRRSEKGNPLDLRAWIDKARMLGEVKDVLGADWNLELGAISELNVKKDAPPALLFDEIAGYPKGHRVLTCSTSSPGKLSSILRLGAEKSHHGRCRSCAVCRRPGRRRRSTTIPWSSPRDPPSRTYGATVGSIFSSFPRRSGTRKTADATSAPAAAW